MIGPIHSQTWSEQSKVIIINLFIIIFEYMHRICGKLFKTKRQEFTAWLAEVKQDTNMRVVPIVGGMSFEKQTRFLKWRPKIVVGTLGRLSELMSGLHSLSFFMLDEADRMIENGHFHEL
ncbi:hypothetical protein G4B88_011521 [Cannabis sativa]|nr:hypothetical protein G4B88_011521 [Cannabis sativa]